MKRLAYGMAAALACAAGIASAADYVWNGGAVGAWNAPANWTPSGTPNAGDRAYFPSETEITDDVALGAGTIVITNGAGTISFKGVISGAGGIQFEGCGEKRLYRDNTFSGGLRVYGTGYRPDGSLIVWNGGTYGDSGAVRIYSGGALGTAQAVFDRNEGSDKGKGYIYNTGCRLYVEGDMTVTTPIDVGFNRDGCPQIYVNAANVAFAETISNAGARNAFRFSPNYGRLTIEKYFKVAGYFSLYNCDAWLDEDYSVGTFMVSDSAGVHLFKRGSVSYMHSVSGRITCEATNVLNFAGGSAGQKNTFGSSSTVDLNGFRQTVASTALPFDFRAGSTITTPVDKPAFLAFDGLSTGVSAITNGANVRGSAGIVWNPASPDAELTLTGASCDTVGELIVSNGVVNLAGAKFTALSKVTVCAGATLKMDDAAAAAFHADWLVLDAAAAVCVGSSAGCAAAVSRLTTVDGDAATQLPCGASYGPGGTPLPQMKGPGTVSVPTPDAARWLDPVSGAWSDATKWLYGVMPDGTLPVVVNVQGGCYTAEVATATTIPSLTVGNLAGTAVVKASAAVSSTMGSWQVGKGGALLVSEGAEAEYVGTDGNTSFSRSDVPVEFRAGSTLEVRGLLSVTNMTGAFRMGDGDASDAPARLVIAGNGEFRFAPAMAAGFQKKSYLTLLGNARVEVSDNGRFTHICDVEHYSWSQQGASFRFRDHAQYYCPAKTWDICMGAGDFLFEDDSSFFAGVKESARVYISNSNLDVPLTVTFKDRASYTSARGGHTEVRPGSGARIEFNFLSDARHQMGNMQLGRASSGYIDVNIADGTVDADGAYGLVFGGSSIYATTQSYMTGTVHQTGGRLLVYGVSGASGDDMNGFVLGDALTDENNRSICCLGRYELVDGLVSNYHGAALFTLGVGRGRGEFVQTGGEFHWMGGEPYKTAPAVIGFSNGEGLFALSNGTARLPNAKLWVGGVETNVYGRTGRNYNTKVPTYTGRDASGRLVVAAADPAKPCAFTLGKAAVFGALGRGTLEMGPGGTFTGTDVTFSNNVESVFVTRVTDAGAGLVSLSGTLAIAPGAKLHVDASALTLERGRFPLVRCAAVEGAFAPADVMVDAPAGVPVQLRASATGFDLFVQNGTVVILR